MTRRHLWTIGWVVAGVVGVLAVRAYRGSGSGHRGLGPSNEPPAAETSTGLPRLLCLGAGACVPCQMMESVRERLKQEYAGRLQVEFIDVGKNSRALEQYGIYMIPTLIFYGPDGRELARREGYMSFEDVLDLWRSLGIALGPPTRPASGGLDYMFGRLRRAVEGAPQFALFASLVWGILSVLLSPCHLAGIPLIIAFIGEQGQITPRRAASLSFAFAGGILLTIAGIGLATALAGRLVGDLGPYANFGVAVIFLVVGLHLLDVIPLTFGSRPEVGWKRKGLWAAVGLGLIFGVALGPCTFAYMAPILAVTFKVSAANWVYGALLLTMYGVGHCAVLVAAGTSYEWIERYLDWSDRSNLGVRVKHACGVLVILAGLWLLYSAR